jgi:nucleoid-associated protein YgaU
MFPPTSRYANIEIAQFDLGQGRAVNYLRRRFVPQPDRFVPLLDHVVVDGDRLDNITARYLGDPEQFWRIADANGAMRPDELTETPGRRLRITLPEGIAAAPNG